MTRKLPAGMTTDHARRRVTCPLPVSLDDLGAVWSHAEAVCGLDGVVDARVSERLGAMAFCARGDGDVWWAELQAMGRPGEPAWIECMARKEER